MPLTNIAKNKKNARIQEKKPHIISYYIGALFAPVTTEGVTDCLARGKAAMNELDHEIERSHKLDERLAGYSSLTP